MDMRLPPPSLCSHVSAQIVQVTTSSRHARRSARISFRRLQQTLPPLIVVRLLSACQCSRPAVGEEGREIPQPKTNIQVQRRMERWRGDKWGDKCVFAFDSQETQTLLTFLTLSPKTLVPRSLQAAKELPGDPE